MKSSLSRFLVPESDALEYLEVMAAALEEAVDLLAQMVGVSPEGAGELQTKLGAIDSHATATHMALLTSLRSAFVTPLPRQDLYLISHWLNRAIENTCTTGTIIHESKSYRLPSQAMDALEILDRQSDLVTLAVDRLRDFDQLESTWIQLERLTHRAERVLVNWRLQDASNLMARNYYFQREITMSLEKTFDALRSLIVEIGQVLVRES